MKQNLDLLPKEQTQRLSPNRMIISLIIFGASLLLIAFFMWSYWIMLHFQYHSVQTQVKEALSLPIENLSSAETDLLIKTRDKMKHMLLVATESRKIMESHAAPKFSSRLEALSLSYTKGSWIQSIEVDSGAGELSIVGEAIHPENMIEMLKKIKQQPGFLNTHLEVFEVTQVAPALYRFKVKSQ